MAYDDVIPLLGDFGRYQKRIYFLLCLPAILCAFHKLGNVFLQAVPDHRCQLPDEQPNASFSLSEETQTTWYKLNTTIKNTCYYTENNTDIYCNEFIYDKSKYESSAVIEWNLVCKRAYLRATTDALFMTGVMLGSIIFGALSDMFGRKLIFFISLVMQVTFGFFAAFAPEFWTYTFSRLIIGATTSGVFLVAYVIAMEMVGPKYRVVAGTFCQMFFSIGYMLVALFAYYIKEWRNLQIGLTVPGIVFLCYWWLIPESARWLITKGRIPKAKKLIQRAAKENKVTISDEQLTTLLESDVKPKDENEVKPSVLHIFKYRNLRRRSMIIFFDWFANSMVYYGLSWNTNNLGKNTYINFVISGAVEIPAYTFMLVTLNRWGRKIILCGCMVTAGISLFLTVFIPKEQEIIIVTLAMLGKLAITASYGVIYIFSTEQFPTVIRNAGLGAGSTSARVGSILAPVINVLADYWTPIPMIVYGGFAFLGGVLSLYLPETLHRKLPESMEEGEAFGRKIRDEETPEAVPLNTTKATNGTAKSKSDKSTKEDRKDEPKK